MQTLLTNIFTYDASSLFTHWFDNCNLNLSPNLNNNLNLFPHLNVIALFFCPLPYSFLLYFVLHLWASAGLVLVSLTRAGDSSS